jgi:hypothetical protein
MVAVSDFSGLAISACALASAPAIVPMDSLRRCITGLHFMEIETDGAGFRSFGADAILELERVRRVKLATIERASAFGGLVVFKVADAELRWRIAMERWRRSGKGLMPPPPQPTDPLATMPSQEPER